jgi:hypothetical protein
MRYFHAQKFDSVAKHLDPYNADAEMLTTIDDLTEVVSAKMQYQGRIMAGVQVCQSRKDPLP